MLGIKSVIKSGFKSGFKSVIKSGIKSGFKSGVESGFKSGIKSGIKSGFKSGVKSVKLVSTKKSIYFETMSFTLDRLRVKVDFVPRHKVSVHLRHHTSMRIWEFCDNVWLEMFDETE